MNGRFTVKGLEACIDNGDAVSLLLERSSLPVGFAIVLGVTTSPRRSASSSSSGVCERRA